MKENSPQTVRDILLTSRRILCVATGASGCGVDSVRAVELELANIGYVVSTKLRDRLVRGSLDQLVELRAWIIPTLLAHAGGDQSHEPLFRQFPDGVPGNTEELWWKKVLVHFLQADNQPCLFCGQFGTTHVLKPCRHVVCDHCFDGGNYSACLVCEHHVDRSSPFFKPTASRDKPRERVTFKLLDLAENFDDEARNLFVSLCQRTQPLAPADRHALIVILREFKARVLPWLPDSIPVRENVAIVFGVLFTELEAQVVLPLARRFMASATDVLRFIAVLSGTDGSLIPETIFRTVDRELPPARFWTQIAKLIGATPPGPVRGQVMIPIQVRRFKMAKLRRSLRRALLDVLNGLSFVRLVEDMLRHQSYWVWVGEFLHPHEYATRYPQVARAFQIIRKKSADGTPAPEFRSWYSRLEEAFVQRDITVALSTLAERPGELARRLDFVLRTCCQEAHNTAPVIAALARSAPALTTPVLLNLASLLPTRVDKAKLRVYWPKGRTALGVSAPDERRVLPERAVSAAVEVIHTELLRRFAEKQAFEVAILDEQLQTIIVPFNERTASSAAVAVPRGSHFPVPLNKTVRLFLHWCQPESRNHPTDLDLSIAFYDAQWRYLGVCSYYELQLRTAQRQVVAQSSGDLRDGPWPEGATEFVDLDSQLAAAMGARFAVMVINAYAGLPFSQLARGFAGLMLRDDTAGQHFDPRTVNLKFSLSGANGIFMPLVLDLQDAVLHWLDVQSKGHLAMNNVESSRAAIAEVCPNLMTYFASGVRPSMYQLAALHAAARCQRVVVRGTRVKQFVRKTNEPALEFYNRLVTGLNEAQSTSEISLTVPVFAALFAGDVELGDGSSAFSLFPERTASNLFASDLLS